MKPCSQACPSTRYDTYHGGWCYMNEKLVPLIVDYLKCSSNRIGKWYGEINSEKKGFHCRCVENILDDCMADMNDNSICQPFFPVIITIETLIVISAIVLNVIICHSFFTKLLLRKENSTVLLFNQAVADIINCLVYALPNNAFLISLNVQKAVREDISKGPKYMDIVGNATLTLTASSSVTLFVVIATDRFLALYKPMWHRVKFHKTIIWRFVVVTWCIAIVLSLIVPIIARTSPTPTNHLETYKTVLLALLVLAVVYVTIVYLITFFLAYKAVYKRPQRTEEAIVLSKKEFKLVCVLIVMYLIFMTCLAPLVVTTVANEPQYGLRSQTFFLLFVLSSLLNPILTLYLKSEFRLGSWRCRKLQMDEIPL